jgi:hypothetical protein
MIYTVAFVCAVASPALAQDSAGDVSAGYRFIHISPTTYGLGWYADASRHVGPTLALVGEVGGSYKRDEPSAVIRGTSFSGETKINLHTFAGGIRLRLGRVAALTPFGQVLVGVSHVSGHVVVRDDSGGVPDVITESTDNAGLLALDGGVIIQPWRALGLRVSAGYMRLFRDRDDNNVVRLNAGIVVPF